jgi:hypothetical protein
MIPERTRAALTAGGFAVGVAAGLFLVRRDGTAAPPASAPSAARPWIGALEAARAQGEQARTAELAHPSPPPPSTVPRNYSAWRSPLDDSGAWAPWVQPLQGETGVYLIRDKNTREVLYVGESHRAKQGLLKTLRRHFWQWSGPTAGPTYSPHRAEVAYELTGPGEAATSRQFELIRKLEPRDNVQNGRSLPDASDVPF